MTITIVHTCTGHHLSYLLCGCLSQQTHDTGLGDDSHLKHVWSWSVVFV